MEKQYILPNDVVFGTKASAEKVITGLLDIIHKYGFATVADFSDLIGGKNRTFKNACYGWRTIDGMIIDTINEYLYHIKLPTPELVAYFEASGKTKKISNTIYDVCDVLIIGVDIAGSSQEAAITISRSNGSKVEIVNTLHGQEATDLYEKLTRIKK